MIFFATCFETSRLPVLMWDMRPSEQSKAFAASASPPTKVINLVNSVFMTKTIHIVYIQVNQYSILYVFKVFVISGYSNRPANQLKIIERTR